MLVIRFRRIGKKNKPSYRIVVAEHSFPIDGRFTADLGSYNPYSKATTLNKEETLVWLNKGAKPSNSVAKVLTREKVKHNSVVIIKKKRSPKKAVAEAVKAVPTVENAVEETTATETPTEETVTEEAPIETVEPTEEVAPEVAESAETPAEEPVPEATPAE